MAHPNRDFSTPVYVHSHIRTFEQTMRHAFDEKVVGDALEKSLQEMVERTNLLVQMLEKQVQDAEALGINLLAISDGSLFAQFREAKESWRIAATDMPNKAQLVAKVAAQLGELEEDANNLTVNEFVDTIVPLYGEQANEMARNELVSIIEANLGKHLNLKVSGARGKPAVASDFKVGKLIDRQGGGTVLLNKLLNRTLKYDEKRRAFVQKKYREDRGKLNAFMAEVERLLDSMDKSSLSTDSIRKAIADPVHKLRELAGHGTYSQDRYKELLSLVNFQMGFLMEAVVAIALHKDEGQPKVNISGNTIYIAGMDEQATITSDVVAKVAGMRVPVGISVKSNLKPVFQHDVQLLNNNKLFPQQDSELRNKLVYFLVNYANLSNWSVEANAEPAFRFKEGMTGATTISPRYATLYERYMGLIQKSSLIQSLLGSVFVTVSLNSQEDITNLIGSAELTSVPLVLQVFDKAFYTHKILRDVERIAKEEGGGFSTYLLGTNVKPNMKKLWDYKYNFISTKIAEGQRYFGGYPTLVAMVRKEGYLPSGDLRARTIVKLLDSFR